MKNKVILISIFLTVLFIVSFFIYAKFYNKQKQIINSGVVAYETICGEYEKGELKINTETLKVDIADDDCKRTLGLSEKESLDNEGMFFVFEKVGNYGFWMKDMNFPLDILWFNDNFEVVGIEKNLSPDTYPKSFGENYFAKFVLEISAGGSDRYNIKVGDKIIFKEK